MYGGLYIMPYSISIYKRAPKRQAKTNHIVVIHSACHLDPFFCLSGWLFARTNCRMDQICRSSQVNLQKTTINFWAERAVTAKAMKISILKMTGNQHNARQEERRDMERHERLRMKDRDGGREGKLEWKWKRKTSVSLWEARNRCKATCMDDWRPSGRT